MCIRDRAGAAAPLVPDDVLDELMARVDAEGAELLGPDGLLSQVTKAVLERAMDRGTPAKIDRRFLSELDHGQGVHLVKVPLSEAAWSTWRRYCQAIGLTMGEGIAGLIAQELGTLVNKDEHH